MLLAFTTGDGAAIDLDFHTGCNFNCHNTLLQAGNFPVNATGCNNFITKDFSVTVCSASMIATSNEKPRIDSSVFLYS